MNENTSNTPKATPKKEPWQKPTVERFSIGEVTRATVGLGSDLGVFSS